MACEKIGDTASYINTHIKNYDNTQRMVEIQKRVGGEKKLNIMEPGRVFIKEGLLNKVCTRPEDTTYSSAQSLFFHTYEHLFSLIPKQKVFKT